MNFYHRVTSYLPDECFEKLDFNFESSRHIEMDYEESSWCFSDYISACEPYVYDKRTESLIWESTKIYLFKNIIIN